MTPRQFFDFFKTKSGKLVLFGLIFGGGMVLFSALRDNANDPMDARALKSSRTNQRQ